VKSSNGLFVLTMYRLDRDSNSPTLYIVLQ